MAIIQVTSSPLAGILICLSLDKSSNRGGEVFLFHYSTVLDFIGLANYEKDSYKRKEFEL